MSTRLTDEELAGFIASVRLASDDPHQDFGDVGFVFEEMEDHRVLDELVVARKVVAAARSHVTAGSDVAEALRQYDALFEERE